MMKPVKLNLCGIPLKKVGKTKKKFKTGDSKPKRLMAVMTACFAAADLTFRNPDSMFVP